MRLPESLTALAPAGELLQALEAGEALLRAETEKANARLLVSTADSAGLARFERDYGLEVNPALSLELRRARIRAQRLGGQTLTRERLAALAVSLAGADAGEVEEDFPHYAVTLTALTPGAALPRAQRTALSAAVRRLAPAHLKTTVLPGAALPLRPAGALHGGLERTYEGEARAAILE